MTMATTWSANAIRRAPSGAALLLFFALGPAASAAAQQTRDSDESLPAYAGPSMRPGDMVRVVFWREPELNGEFPVDETGSAVLPILGRRRVAGVDPDGLKAALVEEYDRQLNNQTVQVTFLTRVRITGAVHRPGLFHVDPTMTLGDALALAGGATTTGRSDEVRLIRNGVEIRSRLSGSDALAGEIRSGDQIVVPERSWISRNGAIALGGAVSALGIVLGLVF